MILLACFMPNFACAVEDVTDPEITEAIEAEQNNNILKNFYINDIEILGANIIKPEFP